MIIQISNGLAMSTYWEESITTHSNWVKWDTPKREEQTDLLAEKKDGGLWKVSKISSQSVDFFKSGA